MLRVMFKNAQTDKKHRATDFHQIKLSSNRLVSS